MPDEVTPTLAIAFVDFTKACDGINLEALWEVTCTRARRRSYEWMAGVRQGYVVAPTLFNDFVNHILHEALLQQPPDKQFGVQIITRSGGALPTDLFSCIVALMYANDLALLADSPDNLRHGRCGCFETWASY
eukprot:363302-Chlamydomonas_euryale.AAC.11